MKTSNLYRELAVCIQYDVPLAGTLCLPTAAAPARPVSGVLLLAGTGGDTRDGDLDPRNWPGIGRPPRHGLMRHLAQTLAQNGIASLRFDKRGCGESGGSTATADYDTDLVDNLAAFHLLREWPEIDPGRVGAIGHSAGALNLCLLCRETAAIAGAGLLGALHGSIEELVRWNWGRVARYWDTFSPEQRQWLIAYRPREVVGGFGVEAFIAAAARGEPWVRLEACGVTLDFPTRRFRQDMLRPVAAEFRHVRCPALVLHGAEDLNVRVDDALAAFQSLRQAGNEAIDLVVLPGLDHHFLPVPPDPARRLWERISLERVARQVAPRALTVVAEWAARVLHSTLSPSPEPT